MSAEHVHRTENLINSGDRRMPEQKYAGQSENRYRRKRRYGWHVFQLLLVLWIPLLHIPLNENIYAYRSSEHW